MCMSRNQATFIVTIQPQGMRILTPRVRVLEVVRHAGMHLSSVCGGNGTCGKCRVQLSPAPKASPIDVKHLSPTEIDAGIRLACQHEVVDGLVVSLVEVSARAKHARALGRGSSLRRDKYKEGDYGLAVDIGTTTLAVYLIDLYSGVQAEEEALLNPQSAFGADVITRIDHATRDKDGALILKQALLDALDTTISQLCERANISTSDIRFLTAVGNTTMEHLFAGLDVRSLGFAPYVPTTYDSLEVNGVQLGLKSVPNATVYAAPVIAGFVGGDTVGFILSESLYRFPGTALGIDIGTNGEIVLVNDRQVWCCSAAAGPAFEGATISRGMRADDGAVEYVTIADLDSPAELSVIGGLPAAGLCGSGILDLVSELTRHGIVDSSGRYTVSKWLLEDKNGIKSYVVAAGAHSRDHTPLLFTQKDVRQVQLAKAAISAGTITLLREADVCVEELEAVYLAGAFGTYLRPESAICIGLLPPLDLSRVVCVGNAAGAGAKRLLLSSRERMTAERIAKSAKYLELASNPLFRDLFVKATRFDSQSLWPHHHT